MEQQPATLLPDPARLCVLPQPEFHSPDPRAIRMWQLSSLIFFGLLMLALLAGALILGWMGRVSFYWLLPGWVLLAALSGWFSFWIPVREWRATGWRLDDKVLLARSGVWFQVIRLLPLNRLQHVDLHRGPLERMFGLASLVLHTAGTHAESITISGLDADEAALLRNRLVALGGEHAE
ncbi:MAG: PH domain-containing protein [Blastocatellia bacterium]